MDVRLPDGTIIRNVPEGTSKSELIARYEKLQAESNRFSRINQLQRNNPAEYSASSPEFQERFGPLSDTSALQRFGIGLDKGVSDVGRGIGQFGVEAANAIPGVNLDEQVSGIRRDESLRRERDKPLNEGAGLAGQVAGNFAVTAPLAALRGFRGAAAAGGLEGGLRPVGENQSRGFNAATGAGFGLAGQGLGAGLGRVGRPVRGDGSDSARLLAREGVELDVPQRTGSEFGQRVRSALGDNPITAGGQRRFGEKQMRQYTRAVLRTIGVNADEANQKVLREAAERIGNNIDDAVRNQPVVLDNTLRQQLDVLEQQAPNFLTPDQLRPLMRNIDDIRQSASAGTDIIDPQKFISIRSNLSKLSRQPGVGEAASELQESLMSALERSGGSREGLKEALAEWRNFRIIENALDKGGEKFVSPLRLSNTVQTKANRAMSLRGLAHPKSLKLVDLAQAGRDVLPDALPQSGTFPRLLIGEGMLAAGGAGGALAAGQDLEGALGIGLGAAALPFLLQRGMQSQGALGNFLSRGAPSLLQEPLTSEGARMLSRQGAISGGLLSGG